MSLISHWQLGFICDVIPGAWRCHCRCHWFHAIIVNVQWKGTVVIGVCLDDMPGLVGWVGLETLVGVALGEEVGVNMGC